MVAEVPELAVAHHGLLCQDFSVGWPAPPTSPGAAPAWISARFPGLERSRHGGGFGASHVRGNPGAVCL